jgi:hypothetical protein
MLKNSAEYERDTSSAKFTAISSQVSPDSVLGVLAGTCQKALVDETEIIRTQMGTHNRSEMVAVHGTLYTIPPRTSNQ